MIRALLTLGIGLVSPAGAFACAVCFGDPDSALTAGMNGGILVLLGVIVSVLGIIGRFMISLRRRMVRLDRSPVAEKGDG